MVAARDGQGGAPRAAGMERAGATLRAALADGATLRRAEIDELLGKQTAHGIGMWVDLVRVPPSGTWERRRADVFGLAEDWIGPPAVDGDPLEHLVARYLRAFGPASRKDVASFTGLKLGDLKPALAALGPERYASESGDELLDMPGAPLPGGDVAAPVRFLPTWDAALLVHARRTQVLPERFRPRIFHVKMPQSVPTFLVDGAVAGTWRWVDGRDRARAVRAAAGRRARRGPRGGRAARRVPRLSAAPASTAERRRPRTRPTSTAAGWGGGSNGRRSSTAVDVARTLATHCVSSARSPPP